jgi:hypothetical protein
MDRVVSQSMYSGSFDTFTQLPVKLPFIITKTHPGYSTSSLLDCYKLVTHLTSVDENLKKWEKTLRRLCLLGTKMKHPHKETPYYLTLQENKDIDRECTLLSGTLCHSNYYNIKFSGLRSSKSAATHHFKFKKNQYLVKKL